ncbi:MAG: protein-disulfide reductase DsbD domain-containing protein [Candidatus Krumholzibacteriia bacterium]
MNKLAAIVLIGCLVTALPALAVPRGSADVVKVAPVQAALAAAPGARIELAVEVTIAPTWHLYAHGDTNFIGVELVPDEDCPLQEFTAVYPEGHEGVFFGEKVRMLEGANVIKATALVPAGMRGEQPLEFKLTVQACDDKVCLAPAHLPVAFTLTVK